MVFAERMLHFTKLSMQAPEEEKKAEREKRSTKYCKSSWRRT